MTRFWTLLSIVLFAVVVGGTAIALYYLSQTQPPAVRTWVSGAGSDSNPCSRSAPCQTFARALVKTPAGGEINCLGPGGFGTVTITKSVTIDCTGTMASILVATPGESGVTINADGIKVTLRNLSINGAGTGVNGVNYTSGAEVTVENCRIVGFNAGINMSLSAGKGTLYVVDTHFSAAATGVRVTATTGSAIAHIAGGTFRGLSLNGVEAATNGIVAINNASFMSNATGVLTSAQTAIANVTNSVLMNNSTALNAFAGTLRIATNKIFNNAAAFNGILQTGGDNKTAGNGPGGNLVGWVQTQ